MAFRRCPNKEEACSMLWAAETGSCGGLASLADNALQAIPGDRSVLI
jgi:hypothetical protein